ncbi:MAG: transposase [Opitutae bacterium]|nr:transposase [Opitutae bacterium]
MAFDPRHGYNALRRGRWSQSGAEYFLTLCTANRQAGLAAFDLVEKIWHEADQLESAGTWTLRTGVVMPDHLHLLARLPGEADLSATVRLFKGRLTPALRTHGIAWQPAFFDHRMRLDEDRLPVFRYLFENPYLANLIKFDERWPGYHCAPADWGWFSSLTNSDCPFPEWLA